MKTETPIAIETLQRKRIPVRRRGQIEAVSSEMFLSIAAATDGLFIV